MRFAVWRPKNEYRILSCLCRPPDISAQNNTVTHHNGDVFFLEKA